MSIVLGSSSLFTWACTSCCFHSCTKLVFDVASTDAKVAAALFASMIAAGYLMQIQLTVEIVSMAFCYKLPNHTHPKHLLPIWIIHVIINDLPTMFRCHLPCRWGNVIQRFPKCLDDFTIHNSHTRYECWGISGKAFVLVSMHVKQPYRSGNVGETCQ